MTDKKKAKSVEVEGLVVKIDVDTSGVAEATAALHALADAANAARKALDKLFETTVVNEVKVSTEFDKEWLENHAGVRPDGMRFKL
jgi:acyl-CoA hydrolase